MKTENSLVTGVKITTETIAKMMISREIIHDLDEMLGKSGKKKNSLSICQIADANLKQHVKNIMAQIKNVVGASADIDAKMREIEGLFDSILNVTVNEDTSKMILLAFLQLKNVACFSYNGKLFLRIGDLLNIEGDAVGISITGITGNNIHDRKITVVTADAMSLAGQMGSSFFTN